MPKQTFFISISDFGSIAGVNPFRSRNEVMMKYWCKNDPQYAYQVLREHGYIVETDENVSVTENLNNVKSELELELDRKRPSQQSDAEEIKSKYAKKVLEACEKDNIGEEKMVQKINDNLTSMINMHCGRNSVNSTLDITGKKCKDVIKKRSSKMHYKVVFENRKFKYLIGGRVDGISKSDVVIDAKYRTCEENVQKNEFDLIQLLGYLFVTGKWKGKIVQKCGNKVWDSNVETENEWGIVEILETNKWNKFLKNDLLTFFESLKTDPTDFSFLQKPFLTVAQGKFHPSNGIGYKEQCLIDIFSGVFYQLPISRKAMERNVSSYTAPLPSFNRSTLKENLQAINTVASNTVQPSIGEILNSKTEINIVKEEIKK